MSEMIDRVAFAIDAVLGDDHESLSLEMGGGGALSRKMRTEAMEKAARAAIEAMREPTEAMTARVGGGPFNREEVVRDWRAMIDEALK